MAAKNKTADEPKKTGRPPVFESPEQFEALAEKYFKECEENKEPPLITGLAVSCGTYRQQIWDYESKPEFTDAIKRAKTRIENALERRCFTSNNPAGAIFLLKNMKTGWADQHEIEHKGGTVSTVIIQGLYGQPGDIPPPAGAVIVQPCSGREAVIAAANKGNGNGNGNGNGHN